jgi:hypothetical protein
LAEDEGTPPEDDDTPPTPPDEEATPSKPSEDEATRPEAAPDDEPPSEDPAPEPVEQAPPQAPPSGPSLDDVAAQIRALPIGPFLLSTISTLASIGYGKLEAGQLDEARGAIDAIGALVPVLEGRVEPELKRDFEQALANLRVAYADASARASS